MRVSGRCAVVVVLGLSLLWAGSHAMAQEDSPKLHFSINGELWNGDYGDEADTALIKAAIIRGIGDGLLFGGSPDIDEYVLDISYHRLFSGLDEFYQDPKNLKVPVIWAWRIFSMRLRGGDEEKISVQLHEFRRRAAALK